MEVSLSIHTHAAVCLHNLSIDAVIDVEVIENVIVELTKNECDVAADSLTGFDAYSLPVLKYNYSTKSYYYCESSGMRKLHAPASSRINMYRSRYHSMMQRVLRNEKFSPSSVESARDDHVKVCSSQVPFHFSPFLIMSICYSIKVYFFIQY